MWGRASQGSHLLALPASLAAQGPLHLQWPIWNPPPPTFFLFTCSSCLSWAVSSGSLFSQMTVWCDGHSMLCRMPACDFCILAFSLSHFKKKKKQHLLRQAVMEPRLAWNLLWRAGWPCSLVSLPLPPKCWDDRHAPP